MTVAELFKQAMDWNIICFDKDAPPNRISKGLLQYMRTAASKQDKIEIDGEWTHMPPFEIETLYIPFGAPHDNLDIPVVESSAIHRYAYIGENGWFPHNKYDVVMGVGVDDKGNRVGLLGAF